MSEADLYTVKVVVSRNRRKIETLLQITYRNHTWPIEWRQFRQPCYFYMLVIEQNLTGRSQCSLQHIKTSFVTAGQPLVTFSKAIVRHFDDALK